MCGTKIFFIKPLADKRGLAELIERKKIVRWFWYRDDDAINSSDEKWLALALWSYNTPDCEAEYLLERVK